MVLKPYAQRAPLGWRIAGRIALVLLGLGCVAYGFYYALTTPFLLKQFLAPLVPLFCITVWALPDSKNKPTRAVEILFWAFFFAAMLWPIYLNVALRGLPQVSAVRLIGLPLAIALLLRLSTSPSFRDEVGSTMRAIPRLGAFMAAFSAIQVFSVAVSDQPVTSLDGVFDNLIGWTAVFFTSCYIFRRPGTTERWAGAFCVCAIGLSLMALWEGSLQHVPWSTHVPTFFSTTDDAVQRALMGVRRLGIGEYRIAGVEPQPLGMAEFLALSTPFLLHFIFGPFRTWIRVVCALAIPLIFFVILGTEARLGVVGFFLSGLLYMGIWGVNRWRTVKGSLAGPAVVLAYPTFFVMFVAASFTVQRLKTMVWGNGETQASNEGRMEQIQMGLPMIARQPWGYGANRGGDKLGYTTANGVLTIDNYFLLVALDWGLLGFLIYYGMILGVTWNAAKYGWTGKFARTREHTYLVPIGIALAEFFVIKSIYSGTHNHTLTYMMMGAAAALIYRIRFGVRGDELPAGAPSGVAKAVG